MNFKKIQKNISNVLQNFRKIQYLKVHNKNLNFFFLNWTTDYFNFTLCYVICASLVINLKQPFPKYNF